MKTVEVNYVEFLSPGTFFSETSCQKIKAWDIKEAIKKSKKIKERHGASPYGFRFFTNKEIDNLCVDGERFEVNSKRVKTSGIYFLTGKVMTFKNIPKTEKNKILLSNMVGNRYRAVVENTNSYKSTLPFNKEDFVIGWDGNVIARGSDYKNAYLPTPEEYYKQKIT